MLRSLKNHTSTYSGPSSINLYRVSFGGHGVGARLVLALVLYLASVTASLCFYDRNRPGGA